MSNEKYTSAAFAEAVAVLAAYAPGAKFGYRFEHDQMWFGPDADVVSEDDAAKLIALGWHIDEESWSVMS